MPDYPFVIGLTGNIATGKSTVGKMLGTLGAEHIDADKLSHQVMACGETAWQQIIDTFGQTMLRADGEIDRKKLGSLVFSDSDALARLESIVHPEVRNKIRDLLQCSSAQAVVIEAIKLLESGLAVQLCNTVWTITSPRDTQIQRLMNTRQTAYDNAVLRIDAQLPQETKVARADVVIVNDGDIDHLAEQVKEAWTSLAQTHHITKKGL